MTLRLAGALDCQSHQVPASCGCDLHGHRSESMCDQQLRRHAGVQELARLQGSCRYTTT
jgi:hypothetical protein